MDASTYLQRKKQSMPQFLARKTFLDAGLRTEVVQKIANTHYTSPNRNLPELRSCTSDNILNTNLIGYNGNVRPVEATPGCASAGLCSYTTSIQTNPSIVIPCVPFPYVSSYYVSQPKVSLYKGTPSQQATAVAFAVNSSNCRV